METRLAFWKSAGLILAVLLIATLLRLPMFTTFEFFSVDEALTSVTAAKILEGGIPYRDAVDHRSPLTNYVYAAVFGATDVYNMDALRVAFHILFLLTLVFIILLGKRLFGLGAGLFAALYAGLVASWGWAEYDTLATHTEFVMIACSVPAAWLFCTALLNGGSTRHLLGAGFLWGLAGLAKQPALLELGCAGSFLILTTLLTNPAPTLAARIKTSIRQGAIFSFGPVLLFALTGLYFYAAGAWDDMSYYFWTYNTDIYMSNIHSLADRYNALKGAFHEADRTDGLSLFVGLGAVLLLIQSVHVLRRRPLSADSLRLQLARLFLIAWTLTGIVGGSLSGRNFGHYFVQSMPGVTLLAGFVFHALFFTPSLGGAATLPEVVRFPRLRLLLLAGFVAALLGFGANQTYVHEKGMLHDRANFKNNPPIDMLLARYITSRTKATDSIFIWGFFPQPYVLAKRRAATRFSFCTFPTGQVPWINVGLADTERWVVPGSRAALVADLIKERPRLIIDASPCQYLRFGSYPIKKYKELAVVLEKYYKEEPPVKDKTGTRQFDVYRLIER